MNFLLQKYLVSQGASIPQFAVCTFILLSVSSFILLTRLDGTLFIIKQGVKGGLTHTDKDRIGDERTVVPSEPGVGRSVGWSQAFPSNTSIGRWLRGSGIIGPLSGSILGPHHSDLAYLEFISSFYTLYALLASTIFFCPMIQGRERG